MDVKNPDPRQKNLQSIITDMDSQTSYNIYMSEMVINL